MCAVGIDSFWPEKLDARSIQPLASGLAGNLLAIRWSAGRETGVQVPGGDRPSYAAPSPACETINPVTGLIQQLWKRLAPPQPAYIVERFRGRRRNGWRTGKLQ